MNDFNNIRGWNWLGKRAGKFQPKPKLKKGKEKPLGVESATPAQAEDVLNRTSAEFDNSVSFGPTSEIQCNSEPKNDVEITRSDDDILADAMNSEDAPDITGEVNSSAILVCHAYL